MEPSRPTFDAIRARRSNYRFSSRPVSDRLLYELLDLANSAPSGFNLQPWHFILVRDPELRGLLSHAALGQEQVREAPNTVVFVTDPEAWRKQFSRMLEESAASGAYSHEYAQVCRLHVDHLCRTGPFGLYGLYKKLSLPFLRQTKPTPPTLTSPQEVAHYMSSQTMLAAATFMIAASGAGLATSPLEGFDEYRLKQLLAIPRSMNVPLIVAVGYPVEGDRPPVSFRFPLREKLSIDLFPNALSEIQAGPKKGPVKN